MNNLIDADFRPDFLDTLDGRSIASRTLRARLTAIYADCGGEDALSYMERSVISRALFMETWIETQETCAAKGKEIPIGNVIQANNALLGLWRSIGLKRRAKDALSLGAYLAAQAEAAELPSDASNSEPADGAA